MLTCQHTGSKQEDGDPKQDYDDEKLNHGHEKPFPGLDQSDLSDENMCFHFEKSALNDEKSAFHFKKSDLSGEKTCFYFEKFCINVEKSLVNFEKPGNRLKKFFLAVE